MEQAVGSDAGSAVGAGVSVQIRERAAGLGHDEGGRSEVPQGHLGFGGDVYRAFGHEAIGPEITIAAQMVEHRQVKYLNNVLEGDHGRLKRILGPKGAFKNRISAYRTLKGMEAMHSLRKGQGTMFAYGHPNPDAVIVNRVFETA